MALDEEHAMLPVQSPRVFFARPFKRLLPQAEGHSVSRLVSSLAST